MADLASVMSLIRDVAVTLGVVIGTPWVVMLLAAQRDAAKEQVKVVKEQVALKEAEAASLRAMSAPTLAEENKRMASFIEDRVRASRELEQKVAQLSGERAELVQVSRHFGIASGCMEGAAALIEIELSEVLRVGLGGGVPSPLLETIRNKAKELFAEATLASEGKDPSFPNAAAFVARLRRGPIEKGNSAFYGESHE